MNTYAVTVVNVLYSLGLSGSSESPPPHSKPGSHLAIDMAKSASLGTPERTQTCAASMAARCASTTRGPPTTDSRTYTHLFGGTVCDQVGRGREGRTEAGRAPRRALTGARPRRPRPGGEIAVDIWQALARQVTASGPLQVPPGGPRHPPRLLMSSRRRTAPERRHGTAAAVELVRPDQLSWFAPDPIHTVAPNRCV